MPLRSGGATINIAVTMISSPQDERGFPDIVDPCRVGQFVALYRCREFRDQLRDGSVADRQRASAGMA